MKIINAIYAVLILFGILVSVIIWNRIIPQPDIGDVIIGAVQE